MSMVATAPKRAKTGGTKGPKAPSTGPISVHERYTLDEFQRRTRAGDGQMRSWRKKGLPVTKLGNVSYISGSDFAAFLDTQAKAQTGK